MTQARKKKKTRKTDPTGTLRLRKQYEAEFSRRWKRVIAAIKRELRDDDAFGLRTNDGNFDFRRDSAKVGAFQKWLLKEINTQLFDGDLNAKLDKGAGRFWGNTFANIAYRRGMLGAVNNLKRKGATVKGTYIEAAIKQSRHAKVLENLNTRAFEDLKGITKEASKQIGETLAKGLAESKSTSAIARAIVDRVEKVGIYRAHLIARTEIIAAYADAELGTYTDAGVGKVQLDPELLTAGDDRVCDVCEAAENKSYTVETARGVIPLHPNCRCAWMPGITSAQGKRINLE